MNPFATLLGEQPRVPETWPADRVEQHAIWTPRDALTCDQYDDRDHQPQPWVTQAQAERNMGLVEAANRVATPRKSSNKKYALATFERKVAAAGYILLPLEPGQKRRRRALPDGTPLRRGRYAREMTRSAAESAGPVYIGPVRAPGEMTYGAAVRLVHRARDGELVDLEELARAHETIEKAREATPA